MAVSRHWAHLAAWVGAGLVLVACATDVSSGGPEATERVSSAVWTNGGFELGAAGTPPQSWTVTTNLNPPAGITVQTPQTFAGLNLAAGGHAITTEIAATNQTDPDLLLAGSLRVCRFGAQCVVASVDARRLPDGGYRCFSHAATIDAGKEPTAWARELADRGAGEILLTSIDRDGTMTGYDLELVSSVAAAVAIPVIASGGAGNYQHMIDVIQQSGASAVACASIFHFTEQTPAGAKFAMQKAGIPVRRNFVGLG